MKPKYKHKARVDLYEKEKESNAGLWIFGIVVFVIFIIAVA